MSSGEKYMWLALDLAKKAVGKTSPNPLVGAVVVKEGEVVGVGYHQKAGEPHAEVYALEEAGEKARGATLYVNLEPCSYHGKTPPCVDKIVNMQIRKVVAAHEDPNPRVAGKGFAALHEKGIKVKVGVLEKEARKINEAFIKYMSTGLPFVTLKIAATLDGKTATRKGASRWITGEKSRELVHRLRNQVDAILTGSGSILKDDPRLTTRLLEGGRDACRVVVDSQARIPLEAKILNLNSSSSTIIAVTEEAPADRVELLRAKKNIEVVVLPTRADRVDLRALMQELGRREIISLLVEGGGILNYALLQEGLVDKIYYFIAPIIFGGQEAPTSFEGEGIDLVNEAWNIEDIEIKRYKEDLLLVGYVDYRLTVHKSEKQGGRKV